ncbi:MAG TPA: 50S ribosomal protein L24 [Gammaproteobacteria bacterium]|jgi:large subunit ribosomal protein L24|nr:50S ribosomal protein L24 [Gammaproteobacteria bacterium]|tara:strand:+ start:1500 stop:1811 length:312 start_codon:yes stop_codon:yes gene_type:complete
MQKLKKDDEVIVIAGRDKGKRGSILSFMKEERVLVSGVNIVKKHKKGDPQTGEQGGIVDQEAPIHISNIAIFNEESGEADRVGVRIEDGKKVRYFKSSGQSVN